MNNINDTIDFILSIRDKVLDGDAEPIKNYVQLKKIMEVAKGCMEEIQPDAITDAQRYGKGEFVIDGAKVQVKESGGKWDFSNVPQIGELKKSQKDLEEMAKQAYKTGATVISPDGEEVSPATYTAGKTTIAISL